MSTIAECGTRSVRAKGQFINNQYQSEHRSSNRPMGLSSRLFYVSLSLFFLVCAGYYAIPLWDSDFWWHIASGREILQNGIPGVDPFGVFSATDAVRNDTVLKGQWLGQVVLYELFDAGGANAVIGFRVLVLLICLGWVVWRSRLLRVGPLVLWPVLAVLAVMLTHFGGERPQLLSFLFAALFFAVLDRVEHSPAGSRHRHWLWALPLITVLWANSHGGVLLGVALLGLWTGLKLLDARCLRQEKIRWCVATLAVALASLATPNGLQTYLYLFNLEGSVLQSRTSEYVSAFQLYTLGHVWPQLWVVVYYVLAAGAAVMLVRQRRWIPLALLVFLGAISASSFRYFMFFLIIAAPYVAIGLQELVAGRVSVRPRVQSMGHAVLALLLMGLLVTGVVRGKMFRGGFLEQLYPVAMADFVAAQHLHGRSFNNMEWGGYLLWRLAPQVKMYIDGRMLDQTRFPPYTNMLWATPQGVQAFERENFQLVMMPYHGRYDPQRYSLIDYLRTRPEWRLLYRDAKGVVFARK
jgi:hypothetical protein